MKTTQETLYVTSIAATAGNCWAALTSTEFTTQFIWNWTLWKRRAKPESLDLSASVAMVARSLSTSTAMFTFAAFFLSCPLTMRTVADLFAFTYRARSHWVSPYRLGVRFILSVLCVVCKVHNRLFLQGQTFSARWPRYQFCWRMNLALVLKGVFSVFFGRGVESDWKPSQKFRHRNRQISRTGDQLIRLSGCLHCHHFLSTIASSAASKLAILRGPAPAS